MANLELSRGERLDQRVVSLLPILSRSFATELIRDGKVRVNGEVTTKAGTKLRPHDDVTLDYSPDEFSIPEIALPVIYEDENCVVINKPAGLLSHSKGAFNPEPSVATWLHNRILDANLLDQDKNSLNNRAGIVHRLDRATSGVMICAKNYESQKFLQKQFSLRLVKKTYMAIIQGRLEPEEAIIDLPIERNPKKPASFRVGANGKSSQTSYKVLQTTENHSLLELSPATGRTHQLRVHLNYLKRPIVGDTFYGGETADRLYLHALTLEITLPSRERKLFASELPPEFSKLLAND